MSFREGTDKHQIRGSRLDIGLFKGQGPQWHYRENYNKYINGRCVGLIKCSVHLILSNALKAQKKKKKKKKAS